VALLSSLLTLLILAAMGSLEYGISKGRAAKAEDSHRQAGAQNNDDGGAT
jgi:hypothetical protein